MLSKTDLDIKCDDLFNSTPIPFVVKKGENHVLEKEIQRLNLEKYCTTITFRLKATQTSQINVGRSLSRLKLDRIWKQIKLLSWLSQPQ
jgi:hypothetical protein